MCFCSEPESLLGGSGGLSNGGKGNGSYYKISGLGFRGDLQISKWRPSFFDISDSSWLPVLGYYGRAVFPTDSPALNPKP